MPIDYLKSPEDIHVTLTYHFGNNPTLRKRVMVNQKEKVFKNLDKEKIEQYSRMFEDDLKA